MVLTAIEGTELPEPDGRGTSKNAWSAVIVTAAVVAVVVGVAALVTLARCGGGGAGGPAGELITKGRESAKTAYWTYRDVDGDLGEIAAMIPARSAGQADEVASLAERAAGKLRALDANTAAATESFQQLRALGAGLKVDKYADLELEAARALAEVATVSGERRSTLIGLASGYRTLFRLQVLHGDTPSTAGERALTATRRNISTLRRNLNRLAAKNASAARTLEDKRRAAQEYATKNAL